MPSDNRPAAALEGTIRLFVATLSCLFAALLVVPAAYAQSNPDGIGQLLIDAQAQYDSANYPAAIALLEQALEQSPEDARVYYYLGHYLHYLCYDSMPLTGYGRKTSDQVLEYLNEALRLDPSLGDARYFLGAEYGVRARDAIRAGDPDRAIAELKTGHDASGYPNWLVEYGRNLLRSCPPNAIVFVQGDAETNAVEYLQLVKRYRADVTAIPVALMNRPWFVSLLKNGLPGCFKPVEISWSNDQILDMHPYKWRANTVEISVQADSSQSDSTSVSWNIEPDLAHDGEKPRYLSAERALLVDILRTNEGRRPVCFSLACPPDIFAGLESHLQMSGMIQILRSTEPAYDLDIAATETLLLNPEHFKDFLTLSDSDMPRVSPMLQNYRTLFLRLAHHYYALGRAEEARKVLAAMHEQLPEEIMPVPQNLRGAMQALEQALQAANR